MGKTVLLTLALLTVGLPAVAGTVWGNFEWRGPDVRRLEETRWDAYRRYLEDEGDNRWLFGVPAAYPGRHTLYPAPGQDTCIWGDKRCVAKGEDLDTSPLSYGYGYTFYGGME